MALCLVLCRGLRYHLFWRTWSGVETGGPVWFTHDEVATDGWKMYRQGSCWSFDSLCFSFHITFCMKHRVTRSSPLIISFEHCIGRLMSDMVSSMRIPNKTKHSW